MSTNGWGKGSVNNSNGWGAGAINNDNGWGDSQLKSWSGDTDIDGGTGIPVNTLAPVISGGDTVGSTLTSTTGTWTGTPEPTFTFKWFRDSDEIVGATSNTYTLVDEDAETVIRSRVTATNIFGSDIKDSNIINVLPTTDPDAQAFITAASITNPTQQSAINQLVTDLKGYGIWSKMKALYPFVGGTASQHKFNLKDPRDLDAAYRLVFNGGWTHSSTGALPNGTNAFANTYLNPSLILSQNNTHLSYYSRTNIISTQVEMGIYTGTNNTYLLYNYSGSAFSAINSSESTRSNAANPTTGMLIGSRTISTQERYFTNNVSQTRISNSTGLANFNIFIGCYSVSGNPLLYSSKQVAFASIGDGLTDTEAANFYTAVQAFQTTLNRQV